MAEFDFYLIADKDYVVLARQMNEILKKIDETYSETTFKKVSWGYTMASSNICIDVDQPDEDIDPQLEEEWLQELCDEYQITINACIRIDFSDAHTKYLKGEEMMFRLTGAMLKKHLGDALLLEGIGRPWLIRKGEEVKVYRIYEHTDFSPLELPYTEYEDPNEY